MSESESDSAPSRRPRAHRAAEADNPVRGAKRRAQPAAPPTENAILSARAPAKSRGQRDVGTGKPNLRDASAIAVAPNSVPTDIEKRFVRVGREFYFPDGARAFTDRGRRLTTPSENTEVIKSLVAIAKARGWQELVVTGTERFRKEAWLAAQVAGLQAKGYRPSELEQAHAVRLRARAAAEPDVLEPQAARPKGRDRPDTGEGTEERHKGWIRGRLIEHGPANYQHDPTQPKSYFVKLETERGTRILWGVDLERALKQSLSRPELGDAVGLRAVRRDPVTVKSRSQGGQPAERDTHRNRWVIEEERFLKERAAAARVFADSKLDAREGVRQHPELLGSYLQLKSAQALAAERIREPADQREFVARVRRALVQAIAHGEPLAPVRLRDAPAPRVPATARREAERNAPLAR